MNHFYTIRLNRKKIILTAAIVLTAALLIWTQTPSIMAMFTKDEPAALSKGNEDVEDVAVTFNISWGEEKVESILDVLEKEDVQATFFVSGEWAERHPDLLEEISEGTHEIGLLGYRYKSYLDQEPEQIRKDLVKAQEVMDKLGYEDIQLLRTPHGHLNEEIIELAESMQFQVVHWNVNPDDWENPGVETIIDEVMEQTENGDIILLHASDSAKQTAEALETVLPGLKNKGYGLITISEMVNQAKADTELID
ncbi:polysaccharide deacetylase family sporulation protein PdaB [Oceanobacillus timonensis]|uniref:polysaccharide deacetylase family sporulation protein PdaB n=1 Tax=Oceanobacillus timonensis TaxID=1926285 RepID=UPI0009B9C323|nr:polysaccharide deacetylase family sporulation protein PdaB [Oceanobacillus timonensis]